MALLGILFAVGLAIFLWWLRVLLTLLHEGPSVSTEGWLASVLVVTVLGPLGAIVYYATRPDRHAWRATGTP